LMSYIGGFLLLMVLGQHAGRTLSLVLGLVWFAASGLWGTRMRSWRCPRCNEPFFTESSEYRPFVNACVHCGLRKWAERPDAESRA
jgi:hypothetical protein